MEFTIGTRGMSKITISAPTLICLWTSAPSTEFPEPSTTRLKTHNNWLSLGFLIRLFYYFVPVMFCTRPCKIVIELWPCQVWGLSEVIYEAIEGQTLGHLWSNYDLKKLVISLRLHLRRHRVLEFFLCDS